MARKFSFPDPDDRSPNDPSIIVSSKKVLGIYNGCHSDDEENMQKVCKKVQDWFTEEANKQNWDEVNFSGNQCILKRSFTKK